MGFEEGDVIAKFLRELILAGKLGHVGLPTWQLFINRVNTLFDVVGEVVDLRAVLLVSHTGFDGVESIEHIALHHNELGHTIYHD